MTQPKMFEEGTKEELIAHFKAASKAWEFIVQGRDAEIAKLKEDIRRLHADMADIRKINKHEECRLLKNKIEALQGRILFAQDGLKDLSEAIKLS